MLITRPVHRHWRPRPAHGLSIVELMVGVTIGLFILAGAAMVVSGQLSDNRRLMLETQVQQDLRAAADLIVRDLRRSGYHGDAATKSVWPQASAVSVAASNPYAAIVPASAASGTNSISYSYSKGTENNTVDVSEAAGFRLNPNGSGTIDMLIGGSWQALTDSNVLEITAFTIVVDTKDLPVPCALACTPGAANCPPVLSVRDVDILITGRARHDPLVQRSMRSNVRLRNDLMTGACPTS